VNYLNRYVVVIFIETTLYVQTFAGRNADFADFGQICESFFRENSGILDPQKFMSAKVYVREIFQNGSSAKNAKIMPFVEFTTHIMIDFQNKL